MVDPLKRSITISVAEEVLNNFPHLRISGLIACSMTVSENQPVSVLADDLELKNPDWGPHGVSADEEIAAWRSVYGQMGVKPSKVKCSFESLFKRYLKDQSPYGINNAVDSYNAVSLQHRLALGAYDLDQLGNNITLRYAQEGEEMIPIGAQTSLIMTEKAIVYADELQVTCAYWNHRDADATKISGNTQKGIFFIDEVDQKPGRAKQALDTLAGLLKSNTGATITSFFHVDKNTPTVTITY